ncbi:MAG: aminopeptidase [Candidatus Nanohaloarchaeota archaeon QJJ-5]|nr:aminopeptidase [Candidatus Nanohaloarchaeota archaeon QJJ-5]
MDETTYDAWADILIEHALDIETGDLVAISYQEQSKDLALAAYEKVLDKGAYPIADRTDPAFKRSFYEEASEAVLDEIPDHELEKQRTLDARISIKTPTGAYEDVEPERMAERNKARRALRDERKDTYEWTLTQAPTEYSAEQADMSYEEFESFVIDACVKDWEQEAQAYEELKDVVDAGEEVRILGEKTDLRFEIGEQDGINRIGVLSDGTNNVPGGEVFTAPIKETVNGTVYFDIPAVINDQAVEGVSVTFEDGEVTEYSAETGEAYLEQLLEADEHAGYLGEFGIGTNFDIQEPTRNILFDEKIGGTIHLAFGNAYEDCFQREVGTEWLDHHGLDEDAYQTVIDQTQDHLRAKTFDSFIETLDEQQKAVARDYKEAWDELDETVQEQKNVSTTHQDLIKDLRDEGSLLIDGDLIMHEGTFIGFDQL